MGLETDIHWISSELSRQNNPSVVEMVKQFLQRQTVINPEMDRRINESLQEFKEGKEIALDQFIQNKKECLKTRFTK